MSLDESLILFATLALLAALPSTSVVLVVTRSATAGLRRGLAVALGIVLGDLLFVAIALLGLTALAEALGGLFLLVKLLGGLYLIWLGGTMLFSHSALQRASANAGPASGLLGSVVAGLLLTLGDLKAILFYASLFPLFVDLDAVGSAELAWMDAGEIVYRAGPDAAPLPPLDDRHIQRLWLGGFAIAWLEAPDTIANPHDDPLGWLCQDDVRAALAQRLAGHPALLAQLDAHGQEARQFRFAS